MRNRKFIQSSLLGLALSAVPFVSSYSQTIPVHGTWVNLPYQDVRNKYMNPAYLDYTSPEFWTAKVNEQADLGMRYIVIMAVANERKSFYPSDFMEPAYDKTKQSPVEAILETADKRGVKVFMSCGWAVDQDDNLKDPKIRELQLKIMEETGKKFGKSAAFYGWYLPVEDSMEPVLSDHAIDAVNNLTAKARTFTSGKKIMISPYGICHAELDNPKFAEQVNKLDVDIIAYQDEVGCVREPQPLPRMRTNFKKLGNIHKTNKIEFWANVESFTWEKGDNSRESALIPAAFPRYLSQMVAVSEAGAKEVISFSTYGIYEKADSPFPMGQPTYSDQVVQDFTDWKAGKGRWKALEKTFHGEYQSAKLNGVSDQKGKSYAVLSDNKLAREIDTDGNWLKLTGKQTILKTSLSAVTNLDNVMLRFLNYRPKGIALPKFVHLSVSNDNKTFKRVQTIQMDQFPNNRFDAWIDIALFEQLNIKAKYIKVEIDALDDFAVYCDELIVNSK